MKILRINKILGLLNEILIISVVFFVPIIFSPPFFLTANTFELNKIALFKILILLMLFLVFARIILFVSVRKVLLLRFREYSKFLIAPAVYLFILFLASIFSIDPEKSFFGAYDRQQGFISSLYYILFFVLLLLNIDSRNKFNRIIIAIISSSAVVSIYGLAQRLGFDFMTWSESIEATGRITSTFGQPNYLGAYLLIVIPITAYYIKTVKSTLIKVLFSGVLILQLFNFIYIYSISIWLSFVAGLLLLFVLFIFVNKSKIFSIFAEIKQKKYSSFKIILVCLLTLIIFGAAGYGINNSNFLKLKIKSVFSLEGSAGTRIILWRAGFDAFKKKSFLGYGPETQGDVLVKYYTKDRGVYSYVNSRPNRAHNIILDTLLTGGIIGLIALIALFYVFYRLLYLSILKQKHAVWPYFVFLSLTGYLLSLLFNFSSITSDIYFWMLFALTLYFYKERGGDDRSVEAAIEISREKKHIFLGLIIVQLILIFIISAPIGYLINRQVKAVVSDHYYFGLKLAGEKGNYFTMLQFYDHIKNELGVRTKYLKQAAMPISNFLLGITDSRYREPGEERITEVLKTIKSDSYSNKILKAKIYSGLTTTDNKIFYQKAVDEYNEIIKMSPDMPSNYMELARFYFSQGENDKALLNYEIAIEKLPSLNDSRLNYLGANAIKKEMYYALNGIGDVYLIKKEYGAAVDNYLLAESYYKKDTSIYRKILKGYYLLGNLERAVVYAEIGYNRDKNDFIWPYNLAQLYFEQKKYDDALRFIEYAGQLDPKNSGIKKLLNDIGNEINKEQ